MNFVRAAVESATRARGFILRLGERQLGLQDFETRCAAGFETLSRRITRAGHDRLQVIEQRELRIRHCAIEVGAADRVPGLDDDLRDLRVGRANRRFGDLDAAAALAAELEWQGERVGLMRFVAIEFDAAFWIQPLAGDGDAGGYR